jgi:hypothetical protein
MTIKSSFLRRELSLVCENFIGNQESNLLLRGFVRFLRKDLKHQKNLSGDVNWKGMVDLMGRFGIGSADAMILNLFLSSHFPILLTLDKDMAYCMKKLNPINKLVFLPDSQTTV